VVAVLAFGLETGRRSLEQLGQAKA